MGVPSIHPNRRTSSRLRDMLAVDVPMWKIASVLELHEATIYRHYGKVISEFERRSGPKDYEPSPEARQKVKMLAGVGIPQKDIARILDINHNTLAKHFRDELDLAEVEANAKVAGNLFLMATGPRDQKTTATAAIWWTKARMGWKDTNRTELTGADGGPVEVENQVVVVLPSNDRDDTIDGYATDAFLDGPDSEDDHPTE